MAAGYSVCESHLADWARAAWRSACAAFALRQHTYLVIGSSSDEDATVRRVVERHEACALDDKEDRETLIAALTTALTGE